MRLKSLLVSALAACIAATSFAFPPAKPMPAKTPMTAKARAGKTRVKGYTYKTKSGKMVKVKSHSRKKHGAVKSEKVKVKGYTYKTKTGKTVKVKAYTRKAPSKGAKSSMKR